ncbi:CapA family protein [Celeribacter sp.]|uniref:CapA family protein n=1 Tax=Celeribacter sp. TaxID=1890673 RepID=UPI003A8F9919
MTKTICDPLSRLSASPLVSLSQLLAQARAALTYAMSSAEENAPLRVFFSISNGTERATVVHFSAPDVKALWTSLEQWCTEADASDRQVRWVRVDWVSQSWALSWEQAQQAFQASKRNYFRYGVALDPGFSQAFLEQELNANAMLYLGNAVEHAGLNVKNFRAYGTRRFGAAFTLPTEAQAPVQLFATEAFLLEADAPPVPLHGYEGGVEGRDTGRRKLADLDQPCVTRLIDDASRFLAEQLDEKGQFTYGLHPCFDREINSYNTLRHASTLYAMLEAWEVTQDAALKEAIDRGLAFLTETLIQPYEAPEGGRVAYLRDMNNELKLGGSAVCLLALVKYTELTGDERHLSLLEALALGIVRLQDTETGQLAHVLNADDLSVKEVFRIIYYDGEAAFGLMRLYGLTKDPRWIATVEKAFDYFIAQEHWKIHDHWLSYCVNELTLYRPEERYFRFGLQNVVGHLDFVLDRITTFPTLLELMMAAHKMIGRLDQSAEHRHLLKQLDRDTFYRVLETRAHHLLNGFFWPEIAMYFKNPARILGSFFIRHHAFRVRIDDVEHYLSGFVAYLRYYLGQAQAQAQATAAIEIAPQASVPSLPHPAQAVVALAGSLNLGGRVHDRARQLGLDQLIELPVLKEADLSIATLDCVVSTLGQQGVDKGEQGPFYRRARPEMIEVLANAGIDAVTVANAHSGDYGPAALLQQKDILDAVGIASAGGGSDREAAFQPTYCQAGELRVALFGIDASQERFAAGEAEAGTAYLSPHHPDAWRLTREFKAAAEQADAVFVSVHWGTQVAKATQRALSQALIDAGADLVFGARDSRLEGVEIYKSKPILPGLGVILSEALRSDIKPGGVFRLGLDRGRVAWVEFLPIGVGYGFCEALPKAAAAPVLADFAARCRAVGTSVETSEQAVVIHVDAPADRSAKPTDTTNAPTETVAKQEKPRRLERLSDFAPAVRLGQATHVPRDARVVPQIVNGLELLGVRLNPTQITRREMLWVETWWRATPVPPDDLKLEYRAVPPGGEHRAIWGLGSAHDPCDWMQPTSRWQAGEIYYDRFGLRPPALEHLRAAYLQLEIRVVGRRPNTDCYLFPKPLPVRLGDPS